MGRSKKCSDNLYLDEEFDILQGKKFKVHMTRNVIFQNHRIHRAVIITV